MNMPAKILPPSFAKRDLPLSIARAAACVGKARLDRSLTALEHAARDYPLDDVVPLILRGATSPIDKVSGAALIPVAMAVLPMLQPFSAAARLFQSGLAISVDSEFGVFTIPNMGLANVQFVADATSKPVVQAVSSGARIDLFEIAGIVTASAELYAQQSADLILQQMLAESAGPALDAVVFSAAAATAAHPAGILNGIAPLTASTGGSGNLSADIITLAGAIAPLAGAGPIGIVGNLAQILPLQLFSAGSFENVVPVASSAVPAGTVIMVALNALVSAMDVPEFTTSIQATLTTDDAPPAWPSGPVRSMWQTDSVAIVMELDVSWALRAAGAVAWMQGVNW